MIQRLLVRNHRGVEIPAVLGLVLLGCGAVSVAAIAIAGGRIPAHGWLAAAGAALVAASGLVDDLAPSGPRGIRGHLRCLATGHISTGVVKLVVIVGCSAWVMAAIPARTGTDRLAGVVLVAACANLWNGLDVRPARALKFFIPLGLVVLAVPWVAVPFAPGVVLGAALVLPWDARERAMLGDAGANLMGFSLGVVLVHALHGPPLVLSVVFAVALNVLGETFTLSRAIEVVPPLRWYDRLGRPPPTA